MTSHQYFRTLLAASLFLGFSCAAVCAQGPANDVPASFVHPTAPDVSSRPISGDNHKFWDRENVALFAASAALSGADFAVTRSNLQNGGRELNPVTRVFGSSSAGLAANFAGENMAVIGLSYFFHRTGHHKLERAVSFVNIGSSGFAVGYGLTHR